MKNILFVILIVSGVLVRSQDKRFFYQHTYAADSLHLDVVKKELMVLDINSDESRFYDYEIISEDSLRKNKEKGKGRYPYINIHNLDLIIKKKKTQQTELYTGLGPNFLVEMNVNPKWDIEKVTKEILGYKVQKATAIINNRRWIAWFTNEIPISDGPYLLQGLPGLILEARDLNNSHSYIVTGIKNIVFEQNKDLPYYYNLKYIKISQSKWKKLVKDYWDYPAPYIPEGENHKYFDVNGKEMSRADFIADEVRTSRLVLKKINNELRYDIIKKVEPEKPK